VLFWNFYYLNQSEQECLHFEQVNISYFGTKQSIHFPHIKALTNKFLKYQSSFKNGQVFQVWVLVIFEIFDSQILPNISIISNCDRVPADT